MKKFKLFFFVGMWLFVSVIYLQFYLSGWINEWDLFKVLAINLLLLFFVPWLWVYNRKFRMKLYQEAEDRYFGLNEKN